MAERLGMIREEMLQRMSAREFMGWMAFDAMQADRSQPGERPAQTPAEILQMFKPTHTRRRAHGH